MAAGDPKLGTRDPWRGDLLTLSTPEDPVPTLYHGEKSYFSQVGRNRNKYRYSSVYISNKSFILNITSSRTHKMRCRNLGSQDTKLVFIFCGFESIS